MEATSKWHILLGLPKWSPEIVQAGLPKLWTTITPDYRVGSRQGLNQSCSSRWDLFNAMLHTQIGCREEVDSQLLVVWLPVWLLALRLPITWAADVQMANARPFSISKFQDLFNDIKNTSMQGVLTLLLSSEHSRVPEDSKSQIFQVLGFTPTLGQSRVATNNVYVESNVSTKTYQDLCPMCWNTKKVFGTSLKTSSLPNLQRMHI
jgi:hypothetical protein